MTDADPVMRRLFIDVPEKRTEELLAVIAGSAVGDEVSVHLQPLSSQYNQVLQPRPIFGFGQAHRQGPQVAIIDQDNLVDFAAIRDPALLENETPQRFFKGVTRYFAQTPEGNDYVLFDGRKEEKRNEALGIKVESALDLLRRLEQDPANETVSAPAIEVPSVEGAEINLFEAYCRMIFPRVDIGLATQELDLTKLDKMLAQSKLRPQVWGWVGAQAVGTGFWGDDIRRATGVDNANFHLTYLRMRGLIDRKPSGPASYRGSEDLITPNWSLRKLFDHRWVGLNQLLVQHGALEAPDAA
jgi:hypothetical protein